MKGPCQALFVQESPKTFFFLSLNQNEKKYSCGTNGQIELKQGSKFKFVHGLNVYKKELSIQTLKAVGKNSQWSETHNDMRSHNDVRKVSQ